MGSFFLAGKVSKSRRNIYPCFQEKEISRFIYISIFLGLPLLEDSEDSDEIDNTDEASNSKSRHRLRSNNSDDYYLKETRTWTSVRDKHLQLNSEGTQNSDIFHQTPKNSDGIQEEQIINLSLSDD